MNRRILRVFSVFMFTCCLALFVTGCHDKYREGRFCATGKIIVDLDLEDGVEIPASASSYRVIVYDSNGVQLMATAAMNMPFRTVVLEGVPVEATTLVLEFRDADDALVAKSTQKVEITLWSVQRVTITNFDNPPGTTGTLKVDLDLEDGVVVPAAASTYRVIVYDSNGDQVAASERKDMPFKTVVVEDVPVEATKFVLEFRDDDNKFVAKSTQKVEITPGEVTEVTVTKFDKLQYLHLIGCYSGDDTITNVSYMVLDKDGYTYEGTVAFSAAGEYDIPVYSPDDSFSVKSVVLKNDKYEAFEWFDYATPKTGSKLTLDIAENEFANGPYVNDETECQVANPRQLNNVRSYLSGKFRQIKNIDFGKSCGIEVTVDNEAYCAKDYNTKAPFYHIYEDGAKVSGWTPIGSEESKSYEDKHPFKGTYDGGGYKISNLICDRWRGGDPYRNRGGLFGFNSGATFKNINTDENCVVIAYQNSSLLVADIAKDKDGKGTTVSHCTSSGKLYVNGYSGGIVGHVREGAKAIITDCVFTGILEAQRSNGQGSSEAIMGMAIGGIVGQMAEQSECTVKNCTFSGSMSISQCATTARGKSYVKYGGGITGEIYSKCKVTIENCKNSGTMQFAAYYCGGISGCSGNDYKKEASLTLKGCTVTGVLDFSSTSYATKNIGGLVGLAWNVPVFEGTNSCTSAMTYSTNASTVGGIVGFSNSFSTSIKNAMKGGVIGDTGTAGGDPTKKIGKYCGYPYVQEL